MASALTKAERDDWRDELTRLSTVLAECRRERRIATVDGGDPDDGEIVECLHEIEALAAQIDERGFQGVSLKTLARLARRAKAAMLWIPSEAFCDADDG